MTPLGCPNCWGSTRDLPDHPKAWRSFISWGKRHNDRGGPRDDCFKSRLRSSLEFNSLPTSHFHRFRPPFVNFLQFFVPTEGLPLLEGLLRVHRDFTSGFREEMFLGNILMELLYAMLVFLKDMPLDSLSKGRLLELRGVVQDLIEARLNLSFLLAYL